MKSETSIRTPLRQDQDACHLVQVVSFLANPERDVAGPDGQQWHIGLVRGNAWPGWSWTRRASDLNLHAGGNDADVIVAALAALVGLVEAPPTIYRWAVYHLRRRTDWRVVVRPAASSSDRDAVLDDRLPNTSQAATRASELFCSIKDGRWPSTV